jgi:hypothetical protein
MSCRFCLTLATSSRVPTGGQAETQAEGQTGAGRATRGRRADSAPVSPPERGLVARHRPPGNLHFY